jgi:hypothetical protein
VLSVGLWEALVLEARRRRMRVSHLVQGRLAASLGTTEGGGLPSEAPANQPVEKCKRHHCRLSLDSLIWDRLAQEATKRRVSVTEMTRQRLREAVLSKVSESRWERPSELRDGADGLDPPDHAKLEPKSIAVYEL